MKKYKLLKPIASLWPGAVFTETKNGYTYSFSPTEYIGFPKSIVEDFTNWFELVQEPPTIGGDDISWTVTQCPKCDQKLRAALAIYK